MLKKVRHWMRMAAVLWLAYGVFKICAFANPLIYRVWHLVPLPWSHQEMTECYGNNVLPWVFTFVAIAGLVGASYVLHRFTKWFWGK